MKPTEFDGVLFYEDFPEEVKPGVEISTSIGGIFANSQMASLNDVKARLAEKCRQLNCNAVVGFQYGQRSTGFLASLISRDDVKWYGTGQAARLPENKF